MLTYLPDLSCACARVAQVDQVVRPVSPSTQRLPMTALLPLRRRSVDRCIVTAEADRLVKKDGRLFGLDRQLGLGFEACYSFYLENGRWGRTVCASCSSARRSS